MKWISTGIAPAPMRSAARPALPWLWWGLLPALLAVSAIPAAAFDYQVHGFAAQGYSISGGNNEFGDSIDGSSDYYEMGLNGTASLLPELLISAQGLYRRAGSTDTEALRLDYAQLDYRFFSSKRANAGLRLGRVKNAYGLYNDTRDVVFTRPGIILPNSVYLENDGLRSILFASDGAQLYGGLDLGNHYLSLEGNYAFDSNLSDKQKLQITGGVDLPGTIRLRNLHLVRLQDDWNGGTLKFALSYLHGVFVILPSPVFPVEGQQTSDIYVVSARYNAAHYTLTSEYIISFYRGENTVEGSNDNAGDGFYIQDEYHLGPRWNLLARYESSFVNRHDRAGRDFAAQTGRDRYLRFSHDETIGLNWQPGVHWGLWLEYHLIQGASQVSALDNRGRTPADHWNLFQAMAGFRF